MATDPSIVKAPAINIKGSFSPAMPSDYSVTIHLLPHTDATRTTPPAQFDPERRDLYEGTILKIGRQVRGNDGLPESAAIAAVLASSHPEHSEQISASGPIIIEPSHEEQHQQQHSSDLQLLSPVATGVSPDGGGGLLISLAEESRARALTSTAESPQSVPAVEVLLAQPGGQQPLVPTKTIEHVWFKSKVVSRGHAEMWLRDGQVYLKDTGSSSGTFLNKMRLSPSGKLSRPYPLKDGDVIQLGIDYQGRQEG
ncbi:hypothetical protein HK100_004496 [Physocladia obscura]|uniref:FHA domain-containing protein n=1 Tax=Physocladia obscura TaxID=109957 RepID=A0AAD5XJI9_9FUNG|nr:hypothetical protein HK100_004496 [Physocladia obscura]